MENKQTVTVIGAGLAGSEAAWQIAQAGYSVRLFEMKPQKFSPAHKSAGFAELICSNSLKAARIDSAAGLLKEEMRRMDSLLVACADKTAVPAGGALAVDRDRFSELVTKAITEHPNIEVMHGEVTEIPAEGVTVIASGPLTSDTLAEQITNLCGGALSFFDAAAPIVTRESLDMEHCFTASRYDKGDDDYINCPMNKEEYDAFYEALITAERAPIHDFDVMNPKVYEGCMPIEVMAQRGHDTIRFGPLKPVGLRDPRTGHRPWAVVQLRTENAEKTLFNLVGFQTNLKFPEQKRVFGMIPGLKNEDSLDSFWEGAITDSKLGTIPVYVPNLMDSTSKLLDVVLMNRIIHQAIPDLDAGIKKVIVYYIDITSEEEIRKFIAQDDSTTVEIELRDLKTVLDDVVIGDYAKFHIEERKGDLFGGYTVVVDTFVSDRVLQKITEFNEKARMNATAKKPFKPIEVSDDGLELIEYLSLDCSNTQGEWHSDSEIKIDKNGYIIRDGEKTKEFWDGTICSEKRPLRLKIRNICGDETVWEVAI